jgi:hypothetical protein
VAVQYEWYINAERGGSRSASKYRALERQQYTAEEIARIDEDYAGEERRGANPRWWEDVEVGQSIGHVVKGPLTTTDIISMHQGMGWGIYSVGPLRYAWRKRQSMPAFYVEDRHGVPDVVQRLHWDEEWACRVGLPAPYDYGQMRTSWLAHLITNWMGDDGWLFKLSTRLESFNFHGDTQRCTGEVTGKEEIGSACLVELAVRATSQRGRVTASGTATVLLPSRHRGPVVLPTPSEELRRLAVGIVTPPSWSA